MLEKIQSFNSLVDLIENFEGSEEISIETPFDEDGEIDHDADNAVRKIARDRNLGITSDRELAFVAKDENGEIVGGAFTSVDQDSYTFDVVVSKDVEGKGVGSKLLDAVIDPNKTISYEFSEMYPNAKIKVDVVNPSMKKMLEKRGFSVEEVIGKDRWIMSPKENRT
jgi:GNAT superfamily N-acetyltransferase